MTDELSGDLLAQWRQGNQHAAAELFGRYANRLIALARNRLSRTFAQRVDPEDVIQSVYRAFFVESRDGRFELQRGGDLWRLLVTMTLHKLGEKARYHRRAKRAVQQEKAMGREDDGSGLQIPLLARDPSPLEAATLADEMEQLLRQLKPLDRRIVELRLQGYTLEEIAAAVERSHRTVCRVLDEVKLLLQARHGKELDP